MRDSLGYLGVFLFVIYGARRERPNSGRAIINAWNEHVRSFPQRKKRHMVILFAAAGIIAVLSYPLSHTFVK